MWDKPRELTDYPGNGYEISVWSSAGITAAAALASWQSSVPHDNVIRNRDIWVDATWQALGVGIDGNYAHAWFGTELDPAAE